MDRVQYITIAEVNNLLGSAYPDTPENNLILNEVSEYLQYVSTNRIELVDLTQDNFRTHNIKLGLSYQFEYFLENPEISSSYSDSGFSIGSYSENKDDDINYSARTMTPRARRYWKLASMLYRGC